MGNTANKNGEKFELVVERDFITKVGCQSAKYTDYVYGLIPTEKDRFILSDPPYAKWAKILQAQQEGKKPKETGKSDLLYVGPMNWTPEIRTHKGIDDVRIECKWQESNGTTYEKVMHSIYDLYRAAAEPNVIIVLGGTQWQKQMIRVWRHLVDKLLEGVLNEDDMTPSKVKHMYVFRYDEFLDWIKRAF